MSRSREARSRRDAPFLFHLQAIMMASFVSWQVRDSSYHYNQRKQVHQKLPIIRRTQSRNRNSCPMIWSKPELGIKREWAMQCCYQRPFDVDVFTPSSLFHDQVASYFILVWKPWLIFMIPNSSCLTPFRWTSDISFVDILQLFLRSVLKVCHWTSEISCEGWKLK